MHQKCSNDGELFAHLESDHPEETKFICGQCGKSFGTQLEFKTHEESHENIIINSDPVPTFPCDTCNDVFLKISALRDHKVYDHKVDIPHNISREKISNGLEERIGSYLNTLHENIESAINTLNEKMDASISILHNTIKRQDKVIEMMEHKIQYLSSQLSKENIADQMTKNMQQDKDDNDELMSDTINVQSDSEADKQNYNANNSKAKMLIVGSSLIKNLHPQVLKHVSNCDITFSKAYTVDHDENAYFPEQNFIKVVPQELSKQQFHVLVLHMGPKEISNINTKNNYRENVKEWRIKVAQTSLKTHNLAKCCLDNYPSLERVIIVKRLPRYDCNIKSHLSVYGNSVLDEIWMVNGGDDRIVIAK